MNVDRIREVGRLILAEPRRFDMHGWIVENDSAPCGTTCCFAGEWAVLEFGIDLVKPGLSAIYQHQEQRGQHNTISRTCSAALGLPDHRIYYVSTWPLKHRKGIGNKLPSTEEYARYFVEVVLEDYIVTNGWDGE